MNTIFTKINLLFFCLLPCLLTAQTEDFFHLKSYNHLNDIAIDSQYIWAATTSGVVQQNKESGAICGIFNASNAPFRSEDITAAAIAPDGKKWFGTQGGYTYSFDDFEWEEVDSMGFQITDFTFDFNGERLVASFENYFNSCGFRRKGIQKIFQQENGTLWIAYQDSYCGGSSSGCGCFYLPNIQKWNGTDWDTLLVDFVPQIRFADFVVTPDDELWITHDSTLNLYHLQNDTLAFQSSTDLEIGILKSISLAPNGDLWLISEQGVFTFDGNNLTEKNEGLANRQLKNITFDNEGNIYATSNYGLFRYENNIWIAYTHGLLSQNNAEAVFAKNGNVWFPNSYGMSLYDGETITNFSIDNSILPQGSNEIIHADSQSGIWLNKLDVDNNYRLFHHDGADWTELNEQNSSLTDFHFSTIKSDENGQIWFEYANPTQDSVARFDSQNWESFATLDEYEAAFFEPFVTPVWSFIGTSMVKNENGVVTEYPIDNFPNVGLQNIIIQERLYTQEGHAWILYYNFLAGFQNKYMTVFDGQEWKNAQGFYLSNIEKSLAKGNQAWFFLEDQVPINISTTSVAYHYVEHQRTTMQYPVYCLSSVNNNELDILDFIEDGDDYWILYNLSRVYVAGPGVSSCRSNVLVKMSGNIFTEISAKDIRDKGLISKIQKDLEGNLWIFRDNGISTEKFIPPILETFSKPAFCNEGRTLACITSGGIPPFNYQWNDGSTNPLKAPVNPGNYSVTVTDTNGNTQTKDLEIGGEGTFMTIQAAAFPVSCTDEADGFLEIIVSGGQPPYQYLWSTGETTDFIENLSTGNYQITVTDALGCTSENTSFLSNPPELLLVLNATDSQVGQADGSIAALPVGGTPPYFYLWNTGAATQNLTEIPGGNYSVTVTDSNGCTEEKSTFLLDVLMGEYNSPIFSKTNGTFNGNQLEVSQKQQQQTDFNNENAEIIIFPNPFSQNLFIDFRNEKAAVSNLEVYNILGQKMELILNENLEENVLKVETNNWVDGTYLIHYQIDSGIFIKKIVKQ